MAGALMKRAHIVFLAAWGLVLADGHAQSLADPTRPPAAFGTPGAADGESEGSSLQSIIHSNRGKPGAIINGEYVLLGGRVGEARLIRIGEDSVTLRSAAGTETLTLFTGVEKTPATGEGQKSEKSRKNRNEGKK